MTNIDLSAELADASRPLASAPMLYDLSQPSDREAVRALFASGAVRHVSDDFDEQLREWHAFLNPTLVFSPALAEAFAAYRDGLVASAPLWQHGKWAWLPWRGTLAHVLDDEAFQQVRTSRNRNLISADEQRKFADAVVGIAGLSVGNSIALSIVLQGGANRIRLADFDRLALSNVNRVRSSVAEFGCNKAEMTARQIYELNPYAKVEIFADGLTDANIDTFFDGLTVAIDEIDNLAIKCLIREQARARRIPVVMAADNGDNGVVDIERYDLDAETPFFHGRMGDVSYAMLKGLDKMGTTRLIAKHVGPENVAQRMRESLFEIGKTLVSWPQLGGAAILNGSAVAYCVRKIACGQPLEGNRALVSLDEKLVPGYDAPEARELRERQAKEFAAVFGI